MKRALELKVRVIREMQEKHGIGNLLQPTAEDAGKMATLDFLADFYYYGSRSWDAAPSREEIEDLPISEILAAVKAVLSGGAEGNG
jgi:hypothetical protein